jgi:hypothetical protein
MHNRLIPKMPGNYLLSLADNQMYKYKFTVVTNRHEKQKSNPQKNCSAKGAW